MLRFILTVYFGAACFTAGVIKTQNPTVNTETLIVASATKPITILVNAFGTGCCGTSTSTIGSTGVENE
jgi:hypothetical protein